MSKSHSKPTGRVEQIKAQQAADLESTASPLHFNRHSNSRAFVAEFVGQLDWMAIGIRNNPYRALPGRFSMTRSRF
jgi:hypothetical protein